MYIVNSRDTIKKNEKERIIDTLREKIKCNHIKGSTKGREGSKK